MASEPIESGDGEAVVVEVAACRYCKAQPVLCDSHASQLVAQAFAEAADVDVANAARSAERELRRLEKLRDAAPVLEGIFLRWFGATGALTMAKQLVTVLEREKGDG